jgi:hypothetical protein
MSSKPSSWYARRYVERFGFHLVPIEPKRKFPRSTDWGNNTLSDPDKAENFYIDHPDWNMGCALGLSQMCSLDIDCDASFSVIMDEFGIEPISIEGFPIIQGASKGRRVMFRVPPGVDLPYQKLSWPSKNDPTGEKHKAAMKAAAEAKQQDAKDREARIRKVAKRWARYTVLELRASSDGKQRQDVMPPSIHPDTGEPYKWLSQPKDDWPQPPEWLLAVWKNWDKFKPQLTGMCPWLPEEKQEPVKLDKKSKDSGSVQGSVIEQFCEAHDLRQMLENYGYAPKGRTRYLSPHSGTGLPGVVMLRDGERCYIHHASDPLCSDETGRPVNAFDLFCYYEHNNDVRSGVKQAAKMLGLDNTSFEHPGNTNINNAPPVSAYEETGSNPVVAGSRDYVSPLLWTNEKGKPLKHIDNLSEICRRLGVNIRYDVIKKNEQIIIPDEKFSIDNEANASLAWLSSECSLFNFPTDKLTDFITYIADQNQFNPVVTWIESKKWDGKQRLQKLCDTITAKGEKESESAKALKETLIKRWLLSAVAAAYLPDGISAPGVLTLQGSQYLGKTKWFKNLVPSELDLIQDGMILKPDDKDSIKQICSFWLVELGELDSTFRKSDIAQLKAFITKAVDILRPAYAKRESKYPRRTIFFASVNPREFLHDQTGNRRFWTIECENINHEHKIDMQQVWSEVKYIWQSGEGYYLTPEEMSSLNEHNSDFMSIDPIEERLLGKLDWDSNESFWRWEQASVIVVECGLDRPTKSDAGTAGQLIRSKNGGKSKRSNGKKLLWCPPLKPRAYSF